LADIGTTIGVQNRDAVDDGANYQYRWYVSGTNAAQTFKLQYLKRNVSGTDTWTDVGLYIDNNGKLQIASTILNTPDVTAVNDFTVYTGTNKTLVLEEPVWVDIDFPIIIRTTGANIPTLTALNGNLTMPLWQVLDFNVCESQEFIHQWKEGSTVYWHLHLTTGALDASDRYVRFTVEYGWVTPNGVWNFPALLDSGDLLIPANTPAKTMFIMPLGSFTPAATIGGHVVARLTRIAATGAAPGSEPWIPMLQMHVQCDTQGSRQISAK